MQPNEEGTAAKEEEPLKSSVFTSRYLQSNRSSPRLDYLQELKQTIEALKGDLKAKEDEIQAQRRDRSALKREYERRIEETRRETRDRVQRVMEKRAKSAHRNQESIAQ